MKKKTFFFFELVVYDAPSPPFFLFRVNLHYTGVSENYSSLKLNFLHSMVISAVSSFMLVPPVVAIATISPKCSHTTCSTCTTRASLNARRHAISKSSLEIPWVGSPTRLHDHTRDAARECCLSPTSELQTGII